MLIRHFRRTLLAAAILAFANPAAAQVYTLTELGDLPGGINQSLANDVNDAGVVVGYSFDGSDPAAFLWTNTSGMQPVNGLTGPGYSFANAINGNGVTVGVFENGSGGSQRAYRVVNGVFEDLSGPYGACTACLRTFEVAKDINDQGMIVGNGGHATFGQAAWIYTDQDGARPIVPGYGLPNYAEALNESGQVVGYMALASGANRAFLWNPGDSAFQNLGLLSGAHQNSYSLDINASGQVAGYSGGNFDRRGFVWSQSTGMLDIGDLAGGDDYSVALGINDAGFVVGNSGAADGRHAFMWSAAGGMIDLNSLVLNSNGFTLVEATAINNNGQIVGYGRNAQNEIRAFLLSPFVATAVPEPGTWAMMLLSFGMVGYEMRRRKGRSVATIRLREG